MHKIYVMPPNTGSFIIPERMGPTVIEHSLEGQCSKQKMQWSSEENSQKQNVKVLEQLTSDIPLELSSTFINFQTLLATIPLVPEDTEAHKD